MHQFVVGYQLQEININYISTKKDIFITKHFIKIKE